MKYVKHWGKLCLHALPRPEMAIFGTVVAVVAAGLGVATALLLCVMVGCIGLFLRKDTSVTETAEDTLNRFIGATTPANPQTGCLIVGVDDYASLRATLGVTQMHALEGRIAERMHTALCANDCVVLMDRGRFAVLLAPTRMIRTETIAQIAVHLQISCELPFDVNGRTVKIVLYCGGSAPENVPNPTARGLLDAAITAAENARNVGPNTIRLAPMPAEHPPQPHAPAIDTLIQPRVNTNTGRVSGLIMVPRRLHRDITTPREGFAETMLRLGTDAIRRWDHGRLGPVPIALRLPPDSLHENGYLNRLIWEIDRYDLDADRFSITISNGILIGPDGPRLQRMVRELSLHGVQIELNGLDTAATTTRMLRTLNVKRLHIPRTVTHNLHQSAGKQRMAATIITMAEQLGLETTAEGVNTGADLSLLAQLGCTHVSGAAISSPVSATEIVAWAEHHETKWAATPRIGTQPTD